MQRFSILFLIFLVSATALAQPSWKRDKPAKKGPLELFHSTMTANFPTTESLKKGDFMYEISHRFLPPVNEGYDAYFGIDGPAYIRTALSYAPADRFMITLGRTNFMDNTDLQVKIKLFEMANNILPSAFAVRLGLGWNTELPEILDRGKADPDNFQYYGQLVYNTMLFDKKLGIGIVPSYLYNSTIFSVEKEYSFTIGNYYQYYFNDMWSVWLEHNAIVTGYQGPIEARAEEKSYNSLSFGFDIETGGHFFHLMLSNNARMNPSQYLVGADMSASDGEWRLGFGITRFL